MNRPLKLFSIVLVASYLAGCQSGGGGGGSKKAAAPNARQGRYYGNGLVQNARFQQDGFDLDSRNDDDLGGRGDDFDHRGQDLGSPAHQIVNAPELDSGFDDNLDEAPHGHRRIDPRFIERDQRYAFQGEAPLYYINTPHGAEIYQGTPEEIQAYLSGHPELGSQFPGQAPPELNPGLPDGDPTADQRVIPLHNGAPSDSPPEVPLRNQARQYAVHSAEGGTAATAQAATTTTKRAAVPQQAPRELNVFAKDDLDWKPGLPLAPLTADKARDMWTNGQAPETLLQYTDAKSDTLMNYARTQAEKIDEKIKEASNNLAARITFVGLQHAKSGWSLDLLLRKGSETETVRLAGSSKSALKEKDKVELGKSYSAKVECFDLKGACESAVINLETTDNKNVKTASVFIVSRLGSAHLTISDTAEGADSNHKAFRKFLEASRFNSCLLEKKTAEKDLRLALEAQCAGKASNPDGADKVRLRSFAVANGPARFDLIFDNKKGPFTFYGELVQSQHPEKVLFSDMSENGFDKLISSAELRANDAGGDLNINVLFGGNEEERFSVTSRVVDTKDTSKGATTPAAPSKTATKATATKKK